MLPESYLIKYSKLIVKIFGIPSIVVAFTGCAQTLHLKSATDATSSAVVMHQMLYGSAQISLLLNGSIYSGQVSKPTKQASGEEVIKFGWKLDHKHPNIKQEVLFLIGSDTLTATDGKKLACDYLVHGDNWRLRCIVSNEKIMFFAP